MGSSLPTAIVELQSVRKPNSLVQQNSPTTPHHTTHQPNMAPKAPSEGQKVDLGQNAPIKNEPAGSDPSGSLAAESSAFIQRRYPRREPALWKRCHYSRLR